jgi:hypothetical protein
MLFCYQGQGWLGQCTDDELSFKLRISLDELEKTRAVFQRQGFIGLANWSLLNWDKRQKPSDLSTPRVKKHRMKQAETVSETGRNENVTAERRGEEIRREQIRLEERRAEAGASTGKRKGGPVSLGSIFSNGLATVTPRRFPTTVAGLLAGGYSFSNKAACHDCGQEIDWWLTPKGGQLPMNVDSAVVHMETCTRALSRAQ